MPGEPNHWHLPFGQCLHRTLSIPPGQSQVIVLAGLIRPKHFARRLAANALEEVLSDQLKVAWTQPERLLTQLPGEDLFCAIVIADKMLQAGIEPACRSQTASGLDHITHRATFAVRFPRPTRGNHQPFPQPTSHAPRIRIAVRVIKPIERATGLVKEAQARFRLVRLKQLTAQFHQARQAMGVPVHVPARRLLLRFASEGTVGPQTAVVAIRILTMAQAIAQRGGKGERIGISGCLMPL